MRVGGTGVRSMAGASAMDCGSNTGLPNSRPSGRGRPCRLRTKMAFLGFFTPPGPN